MDSDSAPDLPPEIDAFLSQWEKSDRVERQSLLEEFFRKHPHLAEQLKTILPTMNSDSALEWPPEIDAFLSQWEESNLAGQQELLEKFCREHPHLAEQLKKILATYEDNKHFVDRAAYVPSTPSPSIDWKNWKSFLPKRIGEFELQRCVGRGGMGAVFEAIQDPLDRVVAVKVTVIPEGDATSRSELILRYRREREVLSNLHHTNILPVFTGGDTVFAHYTASGTDNGDHTAGPPQAIHVFWYAMTLVPGTTLGKVLGHKKSAIGNASGLADFVGQILKSLFDESTPATNRTGSPPIHPSRLKVSEAWITSVVRCVRYLCDAVEHIHQNNYIHCDLKPDNIMLEKNEHPWIIDFGLARSLIVRTSAQRDGKKNGTSSQETAIDRAGPEFAIQPENSIPTFSLPPTVILSDGGGTPQYMAPEQFASGPADKRSDIFAIGEILYELLTLRQPFPCGKYEKLKKDYDWSFPAMDQFADGVSADLEAICRKAMRHSPADRYQTAADMAEDLRRLERHEPVAARPIGKMARFWKWTKRNKSLSGMIGAAAAFVLLAAGFAMYFGYSKNREANVANLHAKDMEQARENELRELYASDIVLASRAIIEGPLARAVDLLDGWLPERRGGVDFRGREWHLLRRRCVTAERTMTTAAGPLLALAWTKDGKRLASAGRDHIIRIWDAETGVRERTLSGHTAGVFDVAFSPDGTLLASASADCTVRLWDIESGKEQRIFPGHILPVYSVAFHPDGMSIVSAGGDTIIKVWDCSTGTERFALQGHEAPVGHLQYNSAGDRLASCGLVGGAIIWNTESRKIMDRIVSPGGDLTFTDDLAYGACTLPGGTFGFIDVAERGIDERNIGLTGIHALAVNSTAKIVAVAGADDTIQVVDRDAASRLVIHRGHIGAARRLAMRSDGRKLASVGDDGSLRIWEIPDPNDLKPYSGHHQHNVTAATFSSDGQRLATGDYLGSIAVWNTETGRRDQVFGAHYIRRENDKIALEVGSGKPLDEGAKKKSRTVLTGGANSRNPIREVIVTSGHGAEVKRLAFTLNGSVLVSVGGQDLIVWDVKSANSLCEFQHPTTVSSLAVSADGTRAATGCWDDIVRLFRLPGGESERTLEGHDDDVSCVAFHPSGQELASGGRDGTVFVWDVASGLTRLRLNKHAAAVSSLNYTPDGKWLISGGMDKSIHVWDAETGSYHSTLHGHLEGVTSLDVSQDGKWLLSASDGDVDKLARIWLWQDTRFREGPLLSLSSNRGATALTSNPVTGDILLGRYDLETLNTAAIVEPTFIEAEEDPVGGGRAEAVADDRLLLLGYALIDETSGWPEGEKISPTQPGSKFLVVAASLPFRRLQLSEEDHLRLRKLRENGEEIDEPLKSSSLLIDPRHFVLVAAGGNPVSSEYIGRASESQQDGFTFMPKAMSCVENLTAKPQPDERELFWLGWEVPEAFMPQALQLQFKSDEHVPVPELSLELFRPGKPFHQALLDFSAKGDAGRLRANATRFPVP